MVKRDFELPAGTLTKPPLLDAGHRLSEHTAPFDATVYILDGEAEIKISNKIHVAKGEMLQCSRGGNLIPKSRKRFKMPL